MNFTLTLQPGTESRVTCAAPTVRREVISVPRRIDVSVDGQCVVDFRNTRSGEVIARYHMRQAFPLLWPVPIPNRTQDIDVVIVPHAGAFSAFVNDLHNVQETVLVASAAEVEKLLSEKSYVSPLQERKR